MKLYKILISTIFVFILMFLNIGEVYSQEAPRARLACFHAAPNTQPVDIVMEDSMGNTTVLFSNISFNSKTKFISLPQGDITINITIAGTNQVILGPARVDLRQGRDHILFLTGLVDEDPKLSAKLLVKKTRPSYFRFFNASPGLGDVSIEIDGSVYFEGVSFDRPTKFEKIDSRESEIVIKLNGETIVTSRYSFEPGKVYTIILVGLKAGTVETRLRIEIIEEG